MPHEPADFLKRYLKERSTMQLATVATGQPWICTVRFVADGNQNIYWTSIPARRHSQEVARHPKVACAIVVQDIIGSPVIGIQIEGLAEVLEPPLRHERPMVQLYAEKFQRDAAWVEDFIAGRTEHRLYKLTPTSIFLLDEENFPGGQRQQVL